MINWAEVGVCIPFCFIGCEILHLLKDYISKKVKDWRYDRWLRNTYGTLGR